MITATWTIQPQSGSAPLTVTFTIKATDSLGRPLFYDFYFGNNLPSVLHTSNPQQTYIYQQKGTYYPVVLVYSVPKLGFIGAQMMLGGNSRSAIQVTSCASELAGCVPFVHGRPVCAQGRVGWYPTKDQPLTIWTYPKTLDTTACVWMLPNLCLTGYKRKDQFECALPGEPHF